MQNPDQNNEIFSPIVESFTPSAKLLPYISVFHHIRQEAGEYQAMSIKGGPKAALVVTYEGSLTRKSHEHTHAVDRVSIAGPVLNPYFLIFNENPTRILLAEFTETGLYQLFPEDTGKYINGFAPGRQADFLAGDIARGETIQKKIDIFENYLLSRIPAVVAGEAVRIERVIDYLKKHGSRCKVEELAEISGTGKRTLERQFKKFTGITLERYICLFRFTRLFSVLLGDEIVDLVPVMHSLGYYDQSHAIRTFKQYAGFSPEKIMREKFRFSADLSRPFVEMLPPVE